MNNKNDNSKGPEVRVNSQMNKTKPHLEEFSPLEEAKIYINHKSGL